jgi:hypothetical protein
MRTKPYTEIGIGRVKCFRCGDKATQQWQVCADNRIYRPMCDNCDIELNEIVLKWAGFKDWKEKMDKYRLRFE